MSCVLFFITLKILHVSFASHVCNANGEELIGIWSLFLIKCILVLILSDSYFLRLTATIQPNSQWTALNTWYCNQFNNPWRRKNLFFEQTLKGKKSKNYKGQKVFKKRAKVYEWANNWCFLCWKRKLKDSIRINL